MTAVQNWRAVIADDEPLARRVIRDLLAEAPDVTVVAECRNGTEVVDLIGRQSPDLLFLDVEMPGATGLAALGAVPKGARPVTILVTAYERFAVPAFEAEVLDFLVKPFTDARFQAALERARVRLAERRTPPAWRRHFLVRLGTRTRAVPASEIRWIEARNYCVRLHTDGPIHLVRHSLTALERELDPGSWVRAHRNALVNLRHAEELQRRPGARQLILAGGERIAVSERCLPAVLDKMTHRP